MLVILNEKNFEEEVLKSSLPVLVDFWAEWCGPCKMMGPIIDELSQEYKEVKVAKLNVEEASSIAEKYNISSIPAFRIFKAGKVVEEFIGAQPKKAIKEKLNKFLT